MTATTTGTTTAGVAARATTPTARATAPTTSTTAMGRRCGELLDDDLAEFWRLYQLIHFALLTVETRNFRHLTLSTGTTETYGVQAASNH
ncbi:hypothetical protein [Nocardia panacis]|uniref:hypothetical protein n=1 Tax=Nocardia panacis TaxID=2340916 RepID=UPI0013152F88|nr:hypothetical protein [Nocardia panacis]